MLASGRFWFGVIVGMALLWGYHRWTANRSTGQ
jgi:hypothetical protein